MTWHVVKGREAAYTRAAIPPEALQGIPHNQNDNVTVVKHDYMSWLRMRARGLIVPGPIAHYGFPGPFDPYFHQYVTADFLTRHPKAFCFNGLGTGKTLAALWAADYLRDQNVINRVLVIAPWAVLDTAWMPELFRTTPHLNTRLLEGSADKKKTNAVNPQTDVVMVNPESLHIIADTACNAKEGGFDLVIVDESTKFKNPQTRRWKALNKFAKQTRYLWLMTGTPAPQSPMDAYGQIRLVRQKYIAARSWKGMTMTQVTRFKWVPKHGASKTIADWMQPAIWYKREDCPDMPDMPEPITMKVRLSKAQQQLSDKVSDEARAMVEAGEINAPNAAAIMTKLLQIQCGGVYATDAQGDNVVHQVSAQPFFSAITDFVEQADTMVLVLSPFRAGAKATYEKLKAAGNRVAIYHGDVSKADRSDILQQARNGQLDALVAIPSTMSHGVDGLQHAARFILWTSPPLSSETYHQTNGRLIRSGQKNKVVLAHIVTSALAKDLYTRLQYRQRLESAILHYIGAE